MLLALMQGFVFKWDKMLQRGNLERNFNWVHVQIGIIGIFFNKKI